MNKENKKDNNDAGNGNSNINCNIGNNNSGKIPLILITGPTASGKSAIGEHLAEKLGGEIVSCDSMQIYRGLDIGTAKPTAKERARVRYHLIDIADITEDFSVADYCRAATDAIKDIHLRGKLPILCGGTGLYAENVIYANSFSASGSDEDYRKHLSSCSNHELFEMLSEIDPASAEKTHENNRKRVVRALEIFHTTGKTKSQWDSESRTNESRYNLVHITLISSDRQYLYEKINRRCEKMISSGLVEEAKLIDSSSSQSARQAIGYKELFGYISGDMTLDEAAELLKKSTRNYAKRQLTWFSRYKDAYKIDISKFSTEEIFALADEYAGQLPI